MHLNFALQMVNPLYFGVEKATCVKWLQNVSFKEPVDLKGNQQDPKFGGSMLRNIYIYIYCLGWFKGFPPTNPTIFYGVP